MYYLSKGNIINTFLNSPQAELISTVESQIKVDDQNA